MLKVRGPYNQYDKEAILQDIATGLSNVQIAAKHNINQSLVSKIRNRTSDKYKTVEYAIREIERGAKPQTIIRKYGEEMYKDALDWYALST